MKCLNYCRWLSYDGNLVIQPFPHSHITDTLDKGLVVAYSKFLLYHVLKTKAELIPVITVEPADKISFRLQLHANEAKGSIQWEITH